MAQFVNFDHFWPVLVVKIKWFKPVLTRWLKPPGQNSDQPCLPPSFIPFWKPLMTLDSNLRSEDEHKKKIQSPESSQVQRSKVKFLFQVLSFFAWPSRLQSSFTPLNNKWIGNSKVSEMTSVFTFLVYLEGWLWRIGVILHHQIITELAILKFQKWLLFSLFWCIWRVGYEGLV